MAVLALLSTRKEKSWMEDYDSEEPRRGFFAHLLANPSVCFRIAMRGGGGAQAPLLLSRQAVSPPAPLPRLASMLVTAELPIGKALRLMDYGGPLRWGETTPQLRCPAGREFAIQSLLPGRRSLVTREGCVSQQFQKTSLLVPDGRLREMLVKDTKVLFLDTFVALAPKEVVKRG